MSRRRSGVVVLVSGGLDSLVLTHTVLQTHASVTPVYVRCGLRWERVELSWLRRWLAALRHPRLKPLSIIDLPIRSIYGTHWSVTGRGIPGSNTRDEAVYLPGRNVLLLGCAGVLAARRNLDAVALGTLAGNPFGDATPGFFRRFGRCLSEALERPMTVLAPLRRLTKSSLIASHRALPFALSFSCIAPRGQRHCGRCNKCAERQAAFKQAGVPDPTSYASGASTLATPSNPAAPLRRPRP